LIYFYKKKITRHSKKTKSNKIKKSKAIKLANMLYEYEFDLIDEEALLKECCQQSFIESILKNDVTQKSTESILLSMFDADDSGPARKDVLRVRNKACAQRARDADKRFIQLLQAELKEILETFELYATYTASLRMHVSCDKEEGTHMFEQRHMAHKANIKLLLVNGSSDPQQRNPDCSTETLAAESIRDRNRKHAQKSRHKKSQYMNDLTKERDECFVTLEQIVKYTSALESSCSFLSDFNEYVSSNLMEIRQKLFDRTCIHQDKYPQLQSYLTFRGTYRVNFK